MRKQQRALTDAQYVDEDGFLLQLKTWTKNVAQTLAQDEVSGDLTEDHWKIIAFLRQYYLEFDTIPPVRTLVRQTGFSLRRIHELFPDGFYRGACKVAGIPKHRVMYLKHGT